MQVPLSLKKNKKNTVCMVAIVKDEEPFIDEWIVYHRMLGIDHFFIYDDDSSYPTKTGLALYTEYCTTVPWSMTGNRAKQGNQIRAYNHALKNYIGDYEWVIFLDVDEFIVLNKHPTLREFLADFEKESAVSLNWLIFGHNGLFDDSGRLITSSLTRRMEVPSEEVKTFTRTAAIAGISYPHFCDLKYGSRVLAAVATGDKNQLTAHINHYQCRSFSRWMKRVERGDVNFDEHHSTPRHQWRLNEVDCLKEFVTNIAFNKNEFVDTSMGRFRFDILEKIAKLDKIPSFLDSTSSLVPAIQNLLKRIAEKIAEHVTGTDELGLSKGKAGMALFLFSYSRYSWELDYEKIAMDSIDAISEQITAETPVAYSTGLAGFGTLIEYLVGKGFIKTDTNETLSDIDELLHFRLISDLSPSIEISTGIAGLGRYFTARSNNPVNDFYHPREKMNVQILSEILGLLEAPYNTYNELIGVIDFISGAFQYVENRIQAWRYLNYAADKMETMFYEDLYFSALPDSFDPLQAAVVLFKAHEKTGSESFRIRANFFLETYGRLAEPRGLPANLSTAQVPICVQLYRQTHDPVWKSRSVAWCKNIIKQYNREVLESTDLSLADGLAGTGMTLLSLVSPQGTDWLDTAAPMFINHFDPDVDRVR